MDFDGWFTMTTKEFVKLMKWTNADIRNNTDSAADLLPPKPVMKEFAGVPWLLSYLNSSGTLDYALQTIIALAYLQEVEVDLGLVRLLYYVAPFDLFPRKKVSEVCQNLTLLGIQISRLAYTSKERLKASRYVKEVLYYGPYFEETIRYNSEIAVMKVHNYDHLVIAFPGLGAAQSATIEARASASSHTADLTQCPYLSGLTDSSGVEITNVHVNRSYIPFIAGLINSPDCDFCTDPTENTILSQYIESNVECMITGQSFGASQALLKGILYAGKYPDKTFKVYVYSMWKFYSNRIVDLIDALPNLEVHVYNDNRDPIVGGINSLLITNTDAYNPLYEDDPLVVIPYHDQNHKILSRIDTQDAFKVYHTLKHYAWEVADVLDKHA